MFRVELEAARQQWIEQYGIFSDPELMGADSFGYQADELERGGSCSELVLPVWRDKDGVPGLNLHFILLVSNFALTF